MEDRSQPQNERIGLRHGKPEDREYLWLLHCATMQDYVDKTWGWDTAWQRAMFDESFDPMSLQIIEDGDEAVGYISVQRHSDRIFLAGIEIEPKQQNHGIGTKLIKQLFEESDSLQLPVTLQVLKVNPARTLYERLGFQCTGETQTHFLMQRPPRPHDARGRSPSEPRP